MKKFYIALSVLALLVLTVVPSQALVGIPDRVPANEFTIPVVVAMDGTLDTLVAINEVGGVGNTPLVPATVFAVHWQLWNRRSGEIIDDFIPYTPNDVTTVAIGAQIIFPMLSDADRASIEADLDTDGVNDHYVCYITFVDTVTTAAGTVGTGLNHLVSKFYWADVPGGRAAGLSGAGREFIDTTFNAVAAGVGYHPYQRVPQNWAGSAPWYDPSATVSLLAWENFEAFSAISYATSAWREQGILPYPNIGVIPFPGDRGISFAGAWNMRFVPRWWLYTELGENNIFIWKSRNQTASEALPLDPSAIGGWTGITIAVYDNEEDGVSRNINLPDELNILDVKEIIPASWIPVGLTPLDQLGGWMNIPMPDGRFAFAVDLLAWNWQRSENASASLNWSSLFEVHRAVGTLPLAAVPLN